MLCPWIWSRVKIWFFFLCTIQSSFKVFFLRSDQVPPLCIVKWTPELKAPIFLYNFLNRERTPPWRRGSSVNDWFWRDRQNRLGFKSGTSTRSAHNCLPGSMPPAYQGDLAQHGPGNLPTVTSLAQDPKRKKASAVFSNSLGTISFPCIFKYVCQASFFLDWYLRNLGCVQLFLCPLCWMRQIYSKSFSFWLCALFSLELPWCNPDWDMCSVWTFSRSLKHYIYARI